jgi:hypothetical protein
MYSGRGPKFRFLPGNRGGPGRPRRTAATEADYLRAFASGCPPDTIREIALGMAAKARDGDTKAAELVMKYLVGAPRPDALAELAAAEGAGFDPGAPWEITEAALLSVIATSPDPQARAWLDSRDPGGQKRRQLGVPTE